MDNLIIINNFVFVVTNIKNTDMLLYLTIKTFVKN